MPRARHAVPSLILAAAIAALPACGIEQAGTGGGGGGNGGGGGGGGGTVVGGGSDGSLTVPFQPGSDGLQARFPIAVRA